MVEKTSFVPVVTKRLTLPVLKMDIDVKRYVKFTGAMHVGKEQKSSRKGDSEPKRAPATLADCINLETGEACQIIIAAVVKSTLEENYSGEAYVGKCFAITKLQQTRGRDYFPYDVSEIADPTNATADIGSARAGRRA